MNFERIFFTKKHKINFIYILKYRKINSDQRIQHRKKFSFSLKFSLIECWDSAESMTQTAKCIDYCDFVYALLFSVYDCVCVDFSLILEILSLLKIAGFTWILKFIFQIFFHKWFVRFLPFFEQFFFSSEIMHSFYSLHQHFKSCLFFITIIIILLWLFFCLL